MGFKINESYEKKKQEDYELQYVMHQEKKIHVDDFDKHSISPELYKELQMNSYARDKIFSKLDTETLIQVTEHYQSFCGVPRKPTVTYDETLIHVIIPELIERIRGLS